MKGSSAVLLVALAVTASTCSNPVQTRASVASRWSPPTAYRDASGQPGPHYWQQRANYRLKATLDDRAHRLHGAVVIEYTNHSPIPLDVLWLHLDMATYDRNSRFVLSTPSAQSRDRREYPDVKITSVQVIQADESYEADYSIRDTRMLVIPRNPIAPQGGTVQLHIEWNFTILPYGERSGRTHLGNDGSIYAIAQWYPRMAVFDDVHGWNALPFISPGEFYAPFGDFHVELELPERFIVAAPGRLTNECDVLTQQQIRRLDKARRSSTPIYVVSPEEAEQPATMKSSEKTKTWVFEAEDIRDFAWTASDRYVWDASSFADTLVMAYYPPEAMGSSREDGFEQANAWTRHAVIFYSRWLGEYPYPVAITAAVMDPIGMEYPMMNFSGLSTRGMRLFGRIDHEISHTWFPMLLGSNERRHAWMDEGMATFINYYSHVDVYGRAVDLNRSFRAPDSLALRIHSADSSIMDSPNLMQGDEYSFLSYDKAGYGLFLLREYVLGPEIFDVAFRAYVERWKLKHPYPEDFFRTIENVSGEDLGWFWEKWFYGNAAIDQGIEKVLVSDGGTGSDIYLMSFGPLAMPVQLHITYEGGDSKVIRLPVEVWRSGPCYTYHVEAHDLVQRAELDPDRYLPDINRQNNVWSSAIR